MKKYILLIIQFIYILGVQAQEWKASWISTMDCKNATNTWMAYRKTLDLRLSLKKPLQG